MQRSTFSSYLLLMTAAERRRAAALVGLMFIGMLLETLGIGLVVPALALMTRTDLFQRWPRLAELAARFGRPSRENLVVAGMLVLVGVSVVKAALLSFSTWAQIRFVHQLQIQISQRLFAGYLHQPYTFHIQRNSAQLIRNALGDVELITHHGVFQGLNLLAEALAVCGICALLLYVEPVGTMVSIGTLVAAGWAFAHFTRHRTVRWSKERVHHEGMRIQHLQQGLGAVKEVKLLGRESEFIERFRVHTRASAHATERNQLMQQLPRLVLELLAMIALAALVIVMIGQHRPPESLVPTIGLFAAAAFRITPSANRIIGAMQGLRFAAPVVATLAEEVETSSASPPSLRGAPFPFERSLRVNDVDFQYPGAADPALRGVTLDIQAGMSVGFIGGSGAGKSTLVDVILGLLAPQRGRILIDDVDARSNLAGWQSNIGYVPQHIYLSDDTLRCNIAFGVPHEEVDDTAVRRAVHAAQLEEFVAELPEGLETKVGERGVRLSGGQLQRIGIARALYHNPRVLVLDEATSSLDIATERGVMEAVRALHGSKTVIIVAHRLSTVEHCDRIYRLEAGRVISAGGAAEMIAKVVQQS